VAAGWFLLSPIAVFTDSLATRQIQHDHSSLVGENMKERQIGRAAPAAPLANEKTNRAC
jgi:hypothetical protein